MSHEDNNEIKENDGDNDQKDLAIILPLISRRSAVVSYNFLMAGLVARLYLYLFGEVDRESIQKIVEQILERTTVFVKIIDEKKPPLRAIYDYLIEREILEDQMLEPDAMAFIDQPDLLQQRIEDSPSLLTDEEIWALLKKREEDHKQVLDGS